jgi:hypothetical protein
MTAFVGEIIGLLVCQTDLQRALGRCYCTRVIPLKITGWPSEGKFNSSTDLS